MEEQIYKVTYQTDFVSDRVDYLTLIELSETYDPESYKGACGRLKLEQDTDRTDHEELKVIEEIFGCFIYPCYFEFFYGKNKSIGIKEAVALVLEAEGWKTRQAKKQPFRALKSG